VKAIECSLHGCEFASNPGREALLTGLRIDVKRSPVTLETPEPAKTLGSWLGVGV